MANNEVTKASSGQVQRPLDIFSQMRDEMDRMFERFEVGFPRFPGMLGRVADRGALLPEIDVHDDGKQLSIDVELPGCDEKDVTVSLANGLLTIRGEKKSEREDKQGSYYVSERSYGSFERSVRLPDTIDDAKLEAKFDKGVLRITAPKRPESVKAEKRIEIKKA